jgi:hypothetical protein
MSIVTLKHKTDVMYKNMSVGSKSGFSLNGTHRNQGYIGQTMLSRSLPRTLMKGNEIKGHGGCCGKYPKHGIVQSAVTSLNDPTVVKTSVQNNNGMLRTHYKWIWRPQPYSTTKININQLNSQSNYIKNISTNTSKKVDASSNLNNPICFKQCLNLPREALPKNNISYQLVQTRDSGNTVKTNFSRPEKNNALLGIRSSNAVNKVYNQQQYIDQLNVVCSDNNIHNNELTTSCNFKQQVNTNLNRAPLIGGTKTF